MASTVLTSIPTKALGYVRVSSEEQASEGVSIEAQSVRIRTWAEANGVELLDIVIDAGVSGSTSLSSRPGGGRVANLLAARKPEASAVIVVRLDRLGRDAADQMALYKRFRTSSVGLVSISERIDLATPHGRAMAQVSAVFAELERSLIAARTTETLAELRNSGKAWNHAPFGFDVTEDGRLVPNVSESATLARILADRSAGLSFDKLAKALNIEGVPSKRGGVWHAMSVRSVVQTAARMRGSSALA